MNARAWAIECRKRRTRSTPAQVAKALGVHPKTVKAWMARGWLTYSVGKRGFALIRAHAVKRCLAMPQVQLVVAKAMQRAAAKENP